jgi:hypothetical protein
MKTAIVLTVAIILMSAPLLRADDLDQEYQKMYREYSEAIAEDWVSIHHTQDAELDVVRNPAHTKADEVYWDKKVENLMKDVHGLIDKKQELKIRVMERNKGKLPEWWKETLTQ